MTAQVTRKQMRTVFAETVIESLASDPRVVMLTADISSWFFWDVKKEYPDRVLNFGIREQAMIDIAGGFALAGMRPVVHTYAPFLIERPFEQIKIGLNHQDVGAVLVSVGASYDDPSWGRTHQGPGDVALLDTLPGWTVHVPGHEDEVGPLLRKAIAGDGRVYMRLSERANGEPVPVTDGFTVLRKGTAGVVIAVGPMLDQVLAATANIDATVLYTSTIRPFDHAGLRAAVADARANVVLVEPYLKGTSSHEVNEALTDVPHRVLSFGVWRDREARAYGTAEDHDKLFGVDPESLAASITRFFN
ncbi:transketolase family protein [Kutzneria kofuensis]|uniref:Transketolase n=1 Tax=Kutzneria kofuensis TaxID=103725 RepID=A0A7W9KL05_9PSEU|nr:transketolase C-terminal domain-containing protein [Kutzneria kofuensis]MBB5893794.1 transketolase [Kutzneria kofuensis]